MPHSSGGGHGGFHGGGSFHGGSYSSARANPTGIQKHYYNGSKRYYFLNKSGEKEYVYSSEDISGTDYILKQQRIASVLIIIPLILYAILSGFIFKPIKKLDKSLLESTRVIVKDEHDFFTRSEKRELKEALELFYDETGIPVEVLVLNISDWNINKAVDRFANNHYTHELRDYAYHQYLRDFDDEGHWLIVFSYEEVSDGEDVINGEDNKNHEGIDFQWEGMQGNDTDSIISSRKGYAFTEELQERFEDESDSYAKDLTVMFTEYSTKMMKYEFTSNTFGIFMEATIFGLGIPTIGVFKLIKASKVDEYFED